jgi:peroxiredoxin
VNPFADCHTAHRAVNRPLALLLSFTLPAFSLLLEVNASGALFGPAKTERPKPLANFSLPDQERKIRELYRQTNAPAVVVVFTSTGCPIVQKSVPKLKALRDKFAARGVVFWLINSTVEDDAASVGQEAREFGIDLPILLDHSQSVARSLGATRTAEAFCIETRSWTIVYRGAIDDQFGYGTEKTRPTHSYLENSLNKFLAGKRIEPARTDAKGCRIQFETR